MEPVHEWIDTGGYEHPGWVYVKAKGKSVHWDEATVEDHERSIDFLVSFVKEYDVTIDGAPDLPWQGPTATPHDQQIAAHREAILRLQNLPCL